MTRTYEKTRDQSVHAGKIFCKKKVLHGMPIFHKGNPFDRPNQRTGFPGSGRNPDRIGGAGHIEIEPVQHCSKCFGDNK